MSAADQPTAHPSRRASLRDELPAAYQGRVPSDRATAPLLRPYLSDPTPAGRDGLVCHYLPLVVAVSLHTLYRWRSRPAPTLEEMVSDGTLGLIGAVERFPLIRSSGEASHFRAYCNGAIRTHIYRERTRRRWGGQASPRGALDRRIRRRLVRTLGRMPTPAEFETELARLVTNPDFHVGERALMFAASDRKAVARAMAGAEDDGREVGTEAIDRETMRLAMKGLDKSERELLKLVLDGHGRREIARRLGVCPDTADRRMRGVLWQSRARADLAAYLGVEPQEAPQSQKSTYLPSPATFPARMVG
jgi:RNA polymerase sigma factor (sigma-70 family)